MPYFVMRSYRDDPALGAPLDISEGLTRIPDSDDQHPNRSSLCGVIVLALHQPCHRPEWGSKPGRRSEYWRTRC
jgi:hypothetical protein